MIFLIANNKQSHVFIPERNKEAKRQRQETRGEARGMDKQRESE
jgi:hypothetical protein